jgi:hypothetical protein
MPSEPRQRPTLETLLQLKRAERPAPEFWEKFDRELRQKQLAALVQERRWWQRLNLGLPRWAYAPAGAAAALALSIVSLRMVMPVAEAPVPVTIQRDVASKADTSLPPVATNLTSGESTPVSVAATESASSAPAVTGQDAAPAPTAESIEAGLTQRVLAGVAEMSPSARTIAASLARLEETDPDLVRSLQTVRFSDARPVRPAVEVQPAAALASWTAGNSRISRLAVADIAYNRPFTPEPAAPEVLRERMARRLGDTDFGSRSRRLDLEGDRLHLRF